MKRKEIKAALIPGDGIGPEVSLAARRLMERVLEGITWEKIRVGQEAFGHQGTPLGPAAVKSLLRVRLALKGPLEGSYAGISYNPNVLLKELFGVYATVRRLRAYYGGAGVHGGIDLVVIKQERNDWPRDFELDSDDPAWERLVDSAAKKDSSVGLKGAAVVRYVWPRQSRQFFEFAFKYAAESGRKRVTLAHRANTMKKTDGLWLRVAEDVGRRFARLEVEDQLVDHVILQMARDPQRFDVIVCPDYYGELLGDLGVGLCGGLGMAPQAHYGVHGAIFTTVHGTAPKYAGLDRANPCAMILSGAEMLGFLGQDKAKKRIETAVARALSNGARTADLSAAGERGMGTVEFTEAVIAALERGELAGFGRRKSGVS